MHDAAPAVRYVSEVARTGVLDLEPSFIEAKEVEPARSGWAHEKPGWSSPRSPWYRTVASAFGVVSILFTALADPILGPDRTAAYHWHGNPAMLFGPVALTTFVLWAALSLLLFSAQKPGRWRVAVWSAVALFLPWIVFRAIVIIWIAQIPAWFHFPRILWAAAMWLLIVLFWRPVYAPRWERVIEFVSAVLLFMALSGAALMTRFLFQWWGARRLNDPLPLRSAAVPVSGAAKPRVIWIVLDELSEDQVFEHRYPGLQLPAFDALAAQATVFTHAVPAGIRTERVMPALFTGKPVDVIRSSAGGNLFVHNPSTNGWSAFQQHATVFQDALDAGYKTGVVGWYNPYCRILPAVLFHCAWSYNAQMVDGIASDGTFKTNLLGVSGALLGNGTLRNLLPKAALIPLPPTEEVEGEIEDFRDLLASGDRLLADSSSNFVLLHMPCPHPPGFYNRVTRQLTRGGRSYVDNLALADWYLGHVRALLERQGEWNGSTVLVMGDHSWRTALIWKHQGKWTAEDERASSGAQFDDRPAYLVKLPGQQTGQRIDPPFRALNTRALLDALLAQRIRTLQDLKQWAAQAQAGPGR